MLKFEGWPGAEDRALKVEPGSKGLGIKKPGSKGLPGFLSLLPGSLFQVQIFL